MEFFAQLETFHQMEYGPLYRLAELHGFLFIEIHLGSSLRDCLRLGEISLRPGNGALYGKGGQFAEFHEFPLQFLGNVRDSISNWTRSTLMMVMIWSNLSSRRIMSPLERIR